MASAIPNDQSEFTLTIIPFAKRNDLCTTTLELGTRLGAVFGKFGRANVQTGTCGGLGSPEIIFEVSTRRNNDVIELVEPAAGFVYMRASCNPISAQRGCLSGAGELEIDGTSADRRVFVDGGRTDEPFFVRYRLTSTEN